MAKSTTWISAVVVVVVLGGGATWMLRQSRGAPSTPPTVAAASPTVPEQSNTAASVPDTSAANSARSVAERTIDEAAAKQRYAILTVYRPNDVASDTMRAAVKAQQTRVAARAEMVAVNRDDPANAALVTRFKLDQAPIPITIVVAPNGAVTGGFPQELKADVNLAKSFVSSGMANVLKVLQDGKLAIVCLQNNKTTLNAKNQALARELAADPQLASISSVQTMDPADRAEVDFYKQCGVNTGARKAQVLLLVPPGKVVGVFDGDTAKDAVMAKLVSACGSGGCGTGGGGCGP